MICLLLPCRAEASSRRRVASYRAAGFTGQDELSAVKGFVVTVPMQNVVGIYNPPGTNQDVVTTSSGNVFVAETPEGFEYDTDGNLTQDG